MLKPVYDEILYGRNYLSLSYAISKLRQNKEILLIDDINFPSGRNWNHYLGLVEKNFLQMFGEEYGIDALRNIDDYLTPVTTVLNLDDLIIELGGSPLGHLNELARKLPSSFSETVFTKISNLSAEYIDSLLEKYMKDIAKVLYELPKGKPIDLISLQGLQHAELAQLSQSLLESLNAREDLKVQELYLTLQILFQSFFSNEKNELEAWYLFIRLLSPQMEIDEKGLEEALAFQFRQLGGDIKATTVKEWEFYQDELKAILLNSFEGIIRSEQLKVFTHINHQFPYEVKAESHQFFSLRLTGKINHHFIDFYKNKRIIFSSEKSLGTDFPYAEVTIDESQNIHGLFIYADFPGTKPSFHFKRAQEFIYQRLEKILPSLNREEWMSETSFLEGSDVWSESKKALKQSEHTFYLTHNKKKAHGIEYWGPTCVETMGLLNYLIEIKRKV